MLVFKKALRQRYSRAPFHGVFGFGTLFIQFGIPGYKLKPFATKKVVINGKSWNILGILSMLDLPRDDSKQTIEQADCGVAVSVKNG
jgi:hypothetical protein